MHLFLNMCNLCRYARFSQAQSQLLFYSLSAIIEDLLVFALFLFHFRHKDLGSNRELDHETVKHWSNL